MTTSAGLIVLDGVRVHEIQSAAGLHKALQAQLSSLLSCKDIHESYVANLELEVTQADKNSWVDVTCAGTHIRFSVVVGLVAGTAKGKVVCTHEYEVRGKTQSYKLGEFMLDERGVTNFIEQTGRPHFLSKSADMIIAYFLAMTFEHNFAPDSTENAPEL